MDDRPTAPRPLRSLLFVPADSERKLARGQVSGADALILDLEDSIAPERKAFARAQAEAAIGALRGAAGVPRLLVRINPLDGPDWQADLAATVKAGPAGIVLPKPRSGEDVHRLSVALAGLEERHGLARHSVRIVAIATEVPLAVLQMQSFIAASTRLDALTWGAEDLSAELGASATRAADGRFTPPFALARTLCLMTAAAAGIEPLDTVYIDFRDTAGLAREAAEAARDGFTGKLAIHPDQVGPINTAFTPSDGAIAEAEAIRALFAANPGAGALALDGRMVDRPHLARAERLLRRAGRL
jgi:citrate lyase subunit beta/citryl-CoA lyase